MRPRRPGLGGCYAAAAGATRSGERSDLDGGVQEDVSFDAEMAEQAAAWLGVPALGMRSIAGHDAYNLARVAPSLMLFTPGRGGITRNPAESIDIARTMPGVRALVEMVVRRAGVA